GTERVRRIHVPIGHVSDGLRRVRNDKGHAGDEDKHYLPLFAATKQKNQETEDRGERDIPPEHDDRRQEGVQPRKASGQYTDWNADDDSQRETRCDATKRYRRIGDDVELAE